MEVIEVTEREVEIVEVIERGPVGPAGAAGTGLETLTTEGDTLYRGPITGERLPIGTAGQILKVNSTATAPEWGEAPATGVTSVSGTAPIASSGGATPTISITPATTSAAGSMSSADKTKLDGIAANANNYTHPNHTGEVTSSGDGATTIANDVVTNAKLANVATATIKGRATAGTGDPEDLTATQVRTILNVADGAEANVQSNWTEADSGSDAFILNKPNLGGAASLNVGTTTGTVCAGDDARLSDSRTPVSHAASHAAGGSDPLAPSDIGAANASHTHGNLTNNGKVGSTAGLPLVTTTAGAVTTLALGTAGQVLTVNSGATGVEFAAAAGGGSKTYAVFTATDNQPPATAFATLDTRNSIAALDFDDATDESAVFVGIIPEGASLGSGLKIRLHWMTALAGCSDETASLIASGFSGINGEFSVVNVINQRNVYNRDFNLELAEFLHDGTSWLYEYYSSEDDNGNREKLLSVSAAAGAELYPWDAVWPNGMSVTQAPCSKNCVWLVSLERMTTDLDSDSFDAIASGTAAANGTSGILTVTEITLTTIDSVTAGDGFRLKVTRDANNGSDSMSGDAELVICEVRSAV